MKTIKTERLTIREFKHEDLGEIYKILDVELNYKDSNQQDSSISQRKKWLDWTIDSYEQQKLLLQPPYGDYAVLLNETNSLIGSVGLVPIIAPFGQLEYFMKKEKIINPNLTFPEVGLFFAISSHYQMRGFAYEAAKAIIEMMFSMYFRRIVAITKKINNPAIAVMKRLGMTIEENPNHPWMQVVGILENYFMK